jgi:hypothetical protein
MQRPPSKATSEWLGFRSKSPKRRNRARGEARTPGCSMSCGNRCGSRPPPPTCSRSSAARRSISGQCCKRLLNQPLDFAKPTRPGHRRLNETDHEHRARAVRCPRRLKYRRRGIEAWQRAAQATDRGVAAALSGILIFRRAIPLHLPCVFLHNRLGDRSMPAPELQIGNRTAYLRKAITSPDFRDDRRGRGYRKK